jgi:hypothetical protein
MVVEKVSAIHLPSGNRAIKLVDELKSAVQISGVTNGPKK